MLGGEGGASFVNIYGFLSCVCHAFVRVCLLVCLVVTCWETADLLALVCGV